ncbi:MAG: hypothetical protein MI974_29930 [Chitinophagales bacterium]|nr:hypothetical protein [Chitinophagales bacterium]
MKRFKILAVLLLTVISIQAMPPTSGINDVLISADDQGDKVVFTIENTGSTGINISYIVIQDDVLMLADGSKTFAPGETKLVEVTKSAGIHEYELRIWEGTRQGTPANSISIEG